MESKRAEDGPIMRLFQVRVKDGCADELLRQFATTSADVVRSEPGNRGYFFGQGVAADGNKLVFASFWANLEAVKQRFGEDWQASYLPAGYQDLIEEHSICHLNVGDGWFVDMSKV